MDATRAPLPARTNGGTFTDRARSALSRMEFVSNQPALRRALPAMAALLAAVVGIALWLLLAPAERIALQTGLPESEKSRAFETLIAGGIEAQLDPSSGALTVAADAFHRARMMLAAEGLPTGTPDGLSTISDMPMGTSRQVESARLRRMQELDLAHSIMELRPVRNARVHLALPERTAFVRDSQPPRASVFVEMAPGTSLTQAQVRAIVSLVSTAVPEMPRGNVSIVDQAGTLLTTEEDNPIAAETDRQMQHQMRLEQMYRDRILALLTPMLGIGNAAVEVTLDMDFTRSEVTSEEYLPQTALRSEQTSSQNSSGGSPAGVPGAVANTPPNEAEMKAKAAGAAAGAVSGTSANSSTRNFEVSRRVETRQPQTARITRVHAAVLLHHVPPEAVEGTDAADDTPTDAGLPKLAEIEALTKSVIGFDATRGDLVTVSTAAFVTETNPILATAWYEAGWLPGFGRVLAQLVVLGILVLGVIKPLLQRLLPPVGRNAAGMAFADAVEVPKGETLSALRRRLETAAPSADDLNGAITYEEKIALLRDMAGAETNRIAGVFKSMLSPAEEDEK